MSQLVKVGIFMTAALVLVGYLIVKIEDLRLFQDAGWRYEASFPSVAGLDDKAPVRVAGVRVGRVDGIRLEARQAVVSLLLDMALELPEGTTASIANIGMLGDKYIELRLGPAGGPLLPAGSLIPGESPVTFDQALAQIDDLAEAVGGAIGSLAGEDGSSLVASLLENLQQTSGDIRTLVAVNREQVTATVGNFERFSGALADELPELVAQFRRLLDAVDGVVSDNRQALGNSLDNVRELTGEMRITVEHLNQISGKIARGEGSIGKLVQSDEAHDSLVATLDSLDQGVQGLSEALSAVRELELELGFEGYYLDSAEETRSAFSLALNRPQSDRFYLLEAVDDPRGRVRSKSELVTVTLPDGTMETTTTERITVESKITFSAQVGFRFGSAQVRAGLFESSGGAAIDYGLLDRKLWLSMEAFDLGRQEDLDPHLRLRGRWRLHPNVSIIGGWDDFLVGERESMFFGAGFSWTDDELKYLLGSIPSF